MSAESMLNANASGADIAYWLFGSFTQNLTTHRITRSSLAETFEENGLKEVAELVRTADYTKALNETVSRRGKPLANTEARSASNGSSRVVIDVLPIPAAKDAVAFEVKWGSWSPEEECGTDLRIGARVLANGSGIWALPPKPQDGGEAARHEACMRVAEAIRAEAFNSVGYVTSTLVSKAMSRAFADCGTYGRFLCDGAKMGIAGRDGTERLRRLATAIKDRHYDGFNGIRLNVVAVPRNRENDEAWGDALLHNLAADADKMAADLEASAGRGKTKASTLDSRRRAAQELLDTIRENQAMLAEYGEMLQSRVGAIMSAYEKARGGLALEVPVGLDETDPGKVAPEPHAEVTPPPDSAPSASPAPVEDDAFDDFDI